MQKNRLLLLGPLLPLIAGASINPANVEQHIHLELDRPSVKTSLEEDMIDPEVEVANHVGEPAQAEELPDSEQPKLSEQVRFSKVGQINQNTVRARAPGRVVFVGELRSGQAALVVSESIGYGLYIMGVIDPMWDEGKHVNQGEVIGEAIGSESAYSRYQY